MATVREFLTRWGFDVDFGPLEKMEAEQKKLRSNFVKLGVVATAALAGITVPAATLEDELRRSAAAAGKTGADFEATLAKLTGQAQNFAEELGVSGIDIARGFFNVISTGIDPLSKEFDDFAATAFRLAKLTGGDVGEAVSQLNTTLVSFREQGESATSIADAFAKANTLADTSVEQLAMAMRTAGPVAAKTFGAGLDTTVGLLAGFAEAGFKAERGGEALKQVVLRLASPIGEAGDVLKKLGVETTNSDGSFRNLIDIIRDIELATNKLTESSKAQALTAIFGQESVGKFAAVLGVGSKRLAELEAGVSDADGSLALALAQMEGLLDVGRKLFQAIKNVAITFGAPLIKPLTTASKFVLNLVTGFRQLLVQNPKLAESISLVGGSLLGLVAVGSALGVLITTFKLVGLAADKMGSKLLLAHAKALALPILLIAAGTALFLFFEDIASALLGQESVILNVLQNSSTGVQWLIGSLLGLGVALALAFAPVTVLVALLATLGAIIFKNRKAYSDFWKMLKNTSFSDLADDVLAWLDNLLGVSKVLEKIRDLGLRLGFDFGDTDAPSVVGGGGGGAGAALIGPPSPFSAISPTSAFAISPGAQAGAAGTAVGDRSVEINLGGVQISGNNPEETWRFFEERFDQKMREASDALLEE